ncbi:MAG: type VI secretion system-associated FHA domain protein TagH [Pseudomonadota bacterium]
MPLQLRIENMDTLPDGGPVSMEIDRRGIDIGRDTFLDWTLPDPERFISGKHCEIHFRDYGYWLHDVSTNGTTVNGGGGRLTEPYQLQNGDRIHIGMYIIAVAVSGPEIQAPAQPSGAAASGGSSADPWGVADAAEAVDRRQFTAQSAPQKPSAVPFGSDLAEEHIGWGIGDAGPSSADPAELDWGAPAGGGGADIDVDWGSPAAQQPAAAPEAATPAADGPGWAATPPSGMPNPAPIGSPDPEPEPAADAAPAAEDAPAADWRAAPAGAASEIAAASPNPAAVPASDPEPVPEHVAEPAPQPAPPAEPEPETEEPLILTNPVSVPEAPAAEPETGALAAQWNEEPEPDAAPEPESPPVAGDPFAGRSAAEPAPEPQAAPTADPVPTPTPTPTPTPPPVQATAPAGAPGGFTAAFERGAGMPAGSVAGRTDEALAEELGRLFRATSENLQAMLMARAETKSAMRSSERTMIGALENNPLKFSPSPEDAMRIMFGEKTKSYLDAEQTVTSSFGDLQKHQLQTFAAMQQALAALIEDLDPESIAGATAKDGALASIVSSRRAKLWDTYVERFQAKSARHERGMIDAFMILFAEMYDRQG